MMGYTETAMAAAWGKQCRAELWEKLLGLQLGRQWAAVLGWRRGTLSELAVGEAVGSCVGLAVGEAVGMAVGEAVGSGCQAGLWEKLWGLQCRGGGGQRCRAGRGRSCWARSWKAVGLAVGEAVGKGDGLYGDGDGSSVGEAVGSRSWARRLEMRSG